MENTKDNNNSNTLNQNHYDNQNLIIEKNSFNYNNKTNVSQNVNEKSSMSENNPIEILKKLDMVHPMNNYFNNIVEPNNSYKVFIRPDGKPDFGNFAYFNNYVKFDPNKYKRPEIYYGFVHDPYVVPQILHGNVNKANKDKNKENEKNEDNKDKKELNIKNDDDKKKKNKSNINKKSKVNTVKSLDDIINKYKLKNI